MILNSNYFWFRLLKGTALPHERNKWIFVGTLSTVYFQYICIFLSKDLSRIIVQYDFKSYYFFGLGFERPAGISVYLAGRTQSDRGLAADIWSIRALSNLVRIKTAITTLQKWPKETKLQNWRKNSSIKKLKLQLCR